VASAFPLQAWNQVGSSAASSAGRSHLRPLFRAAGAPLQSAGLLCTAAAHKSLAATTLTTTTIATTTIAAATIASGPSSAALQSLHLYKSSIFDPLSSQDLA